MASLCEQLKFSGMERDVRQLALHEKLVSTEDIALMSKSEVCELVEQTYTVAYSEDEEIGLVRKEDMKEFNKLVTTISR